MRTRLFMGVTVVLVIILLICGYRWYRRRHPPEAPMRNISQYKAMVTPCVSRQQATRPSARDAWTENARGLAYSGALDRGALELARMYATGHYALGIEPDHDAAMSIYRAILLYGSDSDTKREARWRLFEEPASFADRPRSGVGLPRQFADEMVRRIIANKRYEERQSARLSERQSGRPSARQSERPTEQPLVVNDAHNVHDSGIVGSARRRLKSLDPAPSTMRHEFEHHLVSEACDIKDDETKAMAIYALDTLSSDVHDPLLGMSEAEAADRVWARCSSDPVAKDRVVHALASSIEHGMPVCTTGKVSRLAAALDQPEDMKPVWAIKQQLYALASSVRSSCLDKSSPGERHEYMHNDHSPLKTRMVEQFTTKAKEACPDLPSSVLTPILDDAANNL